MDYKKAASYWVEKEEKAERMDREMLLTQIEKFINDHNTCALATGCGDFVRCTPIEYEYKDERFWLLSEGGLKFRGLDGNKNVCLAIFDSYTGFGQLGGMQISGTAELVEPWTDEYMNLLAFKKIPIENLKKLPTTLYLIKVTPIRIDFLCAEFKNLGYSSRQHLYLSNINAE
ncbi:pyridoxamine 5'-phosphate oxidase family protein [Clostridiales bacterium oral taxon 876 str. F0540]|nr:pyridoxamine 5'-phosphate oxidase family protein [Clostridiales bacterium oral taxon 876 str. F0540]